MKKKSWFRFRLFKGFHLALSLIGLLPGLSSVCHSQGAIDPLFNPSDICFGNGEGPSSPVRTLTFQPDGKIIIGGNYTTYNGIARNRIARLNVDGTLDGTFNSGMGTNNTIRDYNAGLKFCVEHYGEIAICAGIHNEESSHLLVRLMIEKNIPRNHPDIWFSHIAGQTGRELKMIPQEMKRRTNS